DPACLGSCSAAENASNAALATSVAALVPYLPPGLPLSLAAWWIESTFRDPQSCVDFLTGQHLEPVCCASASIGFLSCGGIFPHDPNFKEADPPTNVFGYGRAEAGQTVTYTIHYEDTGTA